MTTNARLVRDGFGRVIQTPNCSHVPDYIPGCGFCEEAQRPEVS